MKKKRLIIVPVVLAIAGVLAWRFILREQGRDGGALRLYGNVDIRQVDLAFRVAGRIEGMRFEEGDRVRAGDLLAVLDKQPFEDEVRMARAQVDVAKADLLKFETGTRPEEIAQAQALVEERKTALANAQRLYERQRDLFRGEAVSRQALDDALTRRDEAQARLQSARKALQMALKGFRAEEVLKAQAGLRAAEAALAQALTRLADTELRAPEDGTVLTRVREPGSVVGAGAVVYSVSLDDPVWVRAYVAEPDLGRVPPGLPVLVYTDSRPDQPYRGQIGFVSPVAEFTPKSVETEALRTDLVYRLRVVVGNPDQGLRQGMPVTVVTKVGETGDADDARK